MNYTEEIPAALEGERVDRVVSMLTDISRSAASRLIDEGAVHLDGEVCTLRSTKVVEGQILAIDVDFDQLHQAPVADAGVLVNVVYADADVVVVDKPAGVVVHPGAGNATGTLVHGLLALYPEIAQLGEASRPGVVHRIDKGTSGLLVVARSPLAFSSLTEQFASHTTERGYKALVWGHVEAAEGLIEAPIGRSGRDATRMVVSVSGKEARTTYQVVKRFNTPLVTLLDCWLETGRTHQIRVHLSAIKHPIVGDDVYGRIRPAIDLTRPFLHAGHLAFRHPNQGEPMVFSSELPEDLEAVLQSLR